MTVIADVFKELFGMFVADFRLTAAVLALVALVAAWLALVPDVDPLLPGLALLAGCLVIIVSITALHARRRARSLPREH